MKIQISVFGVTFAIISILFAKFLTNALAPFLQRTLDLTDKQEQWIFLLLIWSIGYWGYALQKEISSFVSKRKTKKEFIRDQ